MTAIRSGEGATSGSHHATRALRKGQRANAIHIP